VVTPAARREAVAILVERHEMSERRACAVIGADAGRRSDTAADAPTITICASACGRWRRNAAGSATDGSTFCSVERDMS